MQPNKNRPQTLWVCALLAALTLAAFWPVLAHPFIAFDDPVYVTGNHHVQAGLSRDSVIWAFTSGEASNWHPLTWLSHELDAQLFGLKPAGHHFTSLLLHSFNAILLFLLLKRMTNRLWPSAFVAALFALHPLHVESVVWVAERKDVLSTFFGLLCLIGYVRYVEERWVKSEFRNPKSEGNPKSEFRKSMIWYVLALILFALGLMSKPMLVTFPFVLLLLDLWPLRRFEPAISVRAIQGSKFKVQRRFPGLILEKLPFLLLAAASIFITVGVQSQGGAVSSMAVLPLAVRVANAVSAYLKYLAKMFWPADLAVYYPHPALDHSQWPAWEIVAGGLLLAAISALAILRLKRAPWFAVGWFWFLGTLLPVIGLVQAGTQARADRYTYIPLIGIFIIIAWTFSSSSASASASSSLAAPKSDEGGSSILPSRFLKATAILTIAACAVLTRHQVEFWRDDVTLFEHALAVNEKNAPAHTLLATAFARAGKLGFALVHCRAATQADPGFASAWHVSGDVYDALRRPGRAIACYQKAIRINPHLTETWFRLGCIYGSTDNSAEAISSYQAALRLDPDFAPAHNNLAQVWWSSGNHAEGLKEFAEAVRLSPDSPDRRYNFGLALAEDGKLADAAHQFAEAIRLKPDYVQALGELGGVEARAGHFGEAERLCREVLRRYPDVPGAWIKLGTALYMGGQTNQAEAAFANARKLDPKLARKNLESGRAFAGKGQVEAAVDCFMTAAWLEPENVEARTSLGLLLARSGKPAEAVPHLEQALRLAPGSEGRYNLGLALALAGRLQAAIGHYEQALKLKPDSPAALNDLAWILATAPLAELRNGPEAVRLAEHACQLTGGRNAPFLSTLAAAYAEAGRFADAIKTAETARDLSLTAGDKSAADAANSRLDLYRAAKPYRQ